MKTRLSLLLTAIIFILWACCEPEETDAYYLTFSVDMSDVDLSETDSVGIRGDMAPLSWTETYTLDEPDANGIYSAAIPFDKDIECGERIQYKYIINDSIWDNDKFGENGNRLYTYCCADALLPVDKWDELNEFTMESMLTSYEWDWIMSWVYTVGHAKQRGLSMEEIAQEIVEFWNWPMSEEASPADVMRMDQFQMAKNSYGYFEVVTNTPDKAEYIVSRIWEIMLYNWDESGEVYGISAEEMTEMFRHMTQIYMEQMGFTLGWEELGEQKLKITVSR
jgi:hypothetical protein